METISVNGLTVHIERSRLAMGKYAAGEIADELRARLREQPVVRMVFAAAPSQAEMLACLRGQDEIDWRRVEAFHMDEYLGLPANSPSCFANWLRRTIFDLLPFGAVHLIQPGADAEGCAATYAARLKEAPIDIVCCGIGVNGHIAFNDPPADLNDPMMVKAVELEEQCRQQQVEDNCFARLDEVPTHALTMTVPALLAAHAIFCTVPGSSKRHAVRRALLGPIDAMCPASALQRHPRCSIYLDEESAADLMRDDENCR